MHSNWYALGWALLGAVFGVLAVTSTWAFALGAGACFLIGFGVERGVLSRRRVLGALPFEVTWKDRAGRPVRPPPPLGILDWELAFEQEGKRLERALAEVTRGMQAVTEQMTRYGPRFEKAEGMTPQQKVDLSRDFAKHVRSHARRMESAEAGVRSAIERFSDNYLKRVKAYPPEQDLGALRPSVASMHETTGESLGSIKGYRDAVKRLRGMNLQQATNEVLDQLLTTAGRLVDDVEAAGGMADSVLTEIDSRKSTTGVSRAERRRRLRAK